MTKPMDKVIEEFYFQFARRNLGTKEQRLEPDWFFPELVTPKEVADWWLEKLEQVRAQSFQAGVEVVREKIIGMRREVIAYAQANKISLPSLNRDNK